MDGLRVHHRRRLANVGSHLTVNLAGGRSREWSRKWGEAQARAHLPNNRLIYITLLGTDVASYLYIHFKLNRLTHARNS